MFDTALAISSDTLKTLMAPLDARVTAEHQRRQLPGPPPPAQLGSMTFTKGTV